MKIARIVKIRVIPNVKWIMKHSEIWLSLSAPKLFKTPAYDFRGRIVIKNRSVNFFSKKANYTIDCSEITLHKIWVPFPTTWIEVGSTCGLRIYICDGKCLGWSGVFGGTKKLFQKLQKLQSY